MKTTVVHLKYSPWDVRIDRKSKFGNPFPMDHTRKGSRRRVIQRHMIWLRRWIDSEEEEILNGLSNKYQVEHLHLLKGKRIACHCAPRPCHGVNFVLLIKELRL